MLLFTEFAAVDVTNSQYINNKFSSNYFRNVLVIYYVIIIQIYLPYLSFYYMIKWFK
jgi:hypothetical protein